MTSHGRKSTGKQTENCDSFEPEPGSQMLKIEHLDITKGTPPFENIYNSMLQISNKLKLVTFRLHYPLILVPIPV